MTESSVEVPRVQIRESGKQVLRQCKRLGCCCGGRSPGRARLSEDFGANQIVRREDGQRMGREDVVWREEEGVDRPCRVQGQYQLDGGGKRFAGRSRWWPRVGVASEETEETGKKGWPEDGQEEECGGLVRLQRREEGHGARRPTLLTDPDSPPRLFLLVDREGETETPTGTLWQSGRLRRDFAFWDGFQFPTEGVATATCIGGLSYLCVRVLYDTAASQHRNIATSSTHRTCSDHTSLETSSSPSQAQCNPLVHRLSAWLNFSLRHVRHTHHRPRRGLSRAPGRTDQARALVGRLLCCPRCRAGVRGYRDGV